MSFNSHRNTKQLSTCLPIQTLLVSRRPVVEDSSRPVSPGATEQATSPAAPAESEVNALRFHPLCEVIDTPNPNIILRAGDGLCFQASSKILARHSSVFEDLFSLPSDTSGDGQTLIDLPIDSSDILGRTLILMGSTHPSASIQALVSSPDFDRALATICDITNRYDMPHLLHVLSSYCTEEVVPRFLLACATGFELQAVHYSKRLVKDDLVTNSVLNSLWRIAPSYAHRWSAMMSNRDSRNKQCCDKIERQESMHDGRPGFGAACTRGTCRGMKQSESDFPRLRAIANNAAIVAVSRQIKDGTAIEVVRAALDRVIMCSVCRDRFVDTYKPIFASTIDSASKHI